VHAAIWAYQKSFGTVPAFLRSGGTIPVLDTFQQVLELPTVLMGFALPDDRIHAPNEKFHLPNFFRGIETSIWFSGRHGRARVSDLPHDHRLPLSCGQGRSHDRALEYGCADRALSAARPALPASIERSCFPAFHTDNEAANAQLGPHHCAPSDEAHRLRVHPCRPGRGPGFSSWCAVR